MFERIMFSSDVTVLHELLSRQHCSIQQPPQFRRSLGLDSRILPRTIALTVYCDGSTGRHFHKTSPPKDNSFLLRTLSPFKLTGPEGRHSRNPKSKGRSNLAIHLGILDRRESARNPLIQAFHPPPALCLADPLLRTPHQPFSFVGSWFTAFQSILLPIIPRLHLHPHQFYFAPFQINH